MNSYLLFILGYFDITNILGFGALGLLILASATASAAEATFFTLDSNDFLIIQQKKSNLHQKIIKLTQHPDKLLSTILIFNNLVNIAIVLISSFLFNRFFNDNISTKLKFLIEVVGITTFILLFGEIFPKIFANSFNIKFAEYLAGPIYFIQKTLLPLVVLFQKSVYFVNKNINPRENLSLNDISYAFDIVDIQSKENKKIIKKILNFGSIEAHDIMKPRIDVVTVDLNYDFNKVKEIILNNQYSRLPVINGNTDNIEGILYVKDLVLHFNKSIFDWQELIRPAYFIPENMKIDNLLEQFKKKKIHMAIVSDEYGGFSGIVTLEDVIEQIVGEINDEFDEPDENIEKINNNQYIVDGKVMLQDLIYLFNLPNDYFDNFADVETIAGLILEINGDFPKEKQKIQFKNLLFTIEKISNVRIEKIIIENNLKNND